MKNGRDLGTATMTPSGDVEVGSTQQFTIIHRVGKAGVNEGGAIRLEVPGRMGWSRPKIAGNNEQEGLVRVMCSKKNVQLAISVEAVTDVDFVGSWQTLRWLVIRLQRGALAEGDIVTIIYGPNRYGYGPGVKTTTQAYSRDRNREEFTLCVDPDGRSGFQEIARSPWINMIPGGFSRYETHVPSLGLTGEKQTLRITAWDAFYNPCVHHEPWHAHHGLTKDEWDVTVASLNRHNKPGRFVTLIGFEFRDRRGDTNVHFSGDHPTCVPGEVDRIAKVWEYYRKTGEEAITIPHLHAYSNYENPNAAQNRSPGYDVVWHPEDWDRIDPRFERNVEVCSTWGRYEYYRNWPHMPTSGMLKGNSVQDLLARGHRLGILASSDGHKGSPGNTTLVAVYARELTRKAIFDALRDRRCYGVTHARIVLCFEANGHPMGSEIRSKGEVRLIVQVHGTDRIHSVEVVKNNQLLHHHPGGGKLDAQLELKHTQSERTAYYYVRVLQEDEEMAWSSPVWVDLE